MLQHNCTVRLLAIPKFKVQGVERSDSAVARELHKRGGFAGLSERSLAVYLGELRRGKLRWWQTRRAQLQEVVELTGFELADLGFSNASPPQAYAFSTFPALRPIDLIHESLPYVYEDVELRKDWGFKTDLWLAPDSRHPLNRPSPGLYWLQIPQGHGLDLLWQQLVARGHAQCVELPALGGTLPQQASDKLMILRVASPLEVDKNSRGNITPPTSPVLVLSRHPPPTITEPDGHQPGIWHREMLGLSRPIVSGGMRRELCVDWQDRLVAWAIARLDGNESLLSITDVQRWIDSLLPYRSVVSTPDELIALCGVLHQSGHLHRASSRGASLFHACMGNQDNARRLAKLIKHRYLRGSAPWDEALSPGQWAQHLQPGMEDAASIASLVTSVVEEKSVARRRQAQAKLLTSTAESVLSELTGNFGLIRHEDGCYHMQLPFLANGLAGDEVFALVKDGQVDAWSRLYLDPSRRVVVEMALWRLSLGELLYATEQALTCARPNLVQMAAEEALFWSIGLKLAQPQASIAASEQGILQTLAGRIVHRIAITSPKPVTRDLQTPAEALAWVAVCWHWSVNVNFPQTIPQPPDLAWLFPGWATREHLVDYLPEQLPYESSQVLADSSERAGRGAWTTWWPAARRIADDLSAPPSEPPDALAPALVLSCLRHGWPINPYWVRVMGTSYALTSFARQSVAEFDPPAKERLFKAMLTAMDPKSGTQLVTGDPKLEAVRQKWRAMELPKSWLAQDLIVSLDSRSVVNATGPGLFDYLMICLDSPGAAVIRGLAQSIPLQRGWGKAFRILLPALRQESWTTVLEWINHDPGCDIAAWLWKEDALKTIELLKQTSQLHGFATYSLMTATPDQYVPDVAEILSDTQCPALRDGRAAWALDRLPHHGLKLEKLINELSHEEWNPRASDHSQPAEA
ncbi:hypothetical protein DCD74_11610 [Lysobacter oculi]|uniref:Uncharacterized protein n=1 Tax=Solilutibacter oculi TaxID=2698682 RepID=A0A344J877_9GAMM|nr:hypothetical protein DCD74_11610 [Lysobacter oculi]